MADIIEKRGFRVEKGAERDETGAHGGEIKNEREEKPTRAAFERR